MLPEVLSPQPQRPLKRKILDDDNLDRPSTRIKRALLDHFPDLLLAPQTESRCRSDSFLLRIMSAESDSSRPKRDRRLPRRYDDELPPRSDSVPTETYRTSQLSPSPASLSSSFFLNRSPVSYRGSAFTPATTASTSCSDDSRSSSRVKSPTYRHDLFRNNIEVNPNELPPSLRDYGRQIIRRTRDSPGLQDSQAQEAVGTLRSLQNEDEDTIKSGYMSAQLLPSAIPYPGKIKMGSNIPFDSAALPHVPLAPPLANPRPDQHYCLDPRTFTDDEDTKQSVGVLRPFAKPSTAGCWPYFTVEFKSEARGGTFWVAENQNAGNGALCVNSMEKLLSIVQAKHSEIDSISFSCNINARNADIWIHYCRNQRFFSAELEHFHMGRSRDVFYFRNSIKNIVEFGFKDRLPQIQALLAKISLPDLEFADKSRRMRKADESDIMQRKSLAPDHIATSTNDEQQAPVG